MKLSDYLEKHGLTMTDFAVQIGCNKSTVSRLVNKLTEPDWATVRAINKATKGKVTANDFMA